MDIYRKTTGLTLEELQERQREASFEAAIRAGNLYKERVLSEEGMLASNEAGARLRISIEALETMAYEKKVLRLEGQNSRCRYPVFQFEHRVFPIIEELFAAMPYSNPWGIYLFLTQPDPALYPGTPLDWINNGEEEAVLRLAKALSEA